MQKEIFIVEDSSDFRQIVRMIFTRFLPDYHVRFFQGVAELYKYMVLQSDENYKGRRPALIIMDLKMPTINGFEAVKMLRQTPSNVVTHWQTIPVVMLSSMASQEDINKCYQIGATSFFIKPVDFDELKQLLVHMCHYWVDHNKLAITYTNTRPSTDRQKDQSTGAAPHLNYQ
ncbi:response regulator [Dyadobacter sp. CY312]|uniref:response regulator n=1 Tax=Dyadobacter sp. CY312 TaxID=2907303 RepID=UPI001F3B89C6|nr:response regulator [Dyadobacter sp. CY312]MCE7042855.1 response regulator [Dyadobacter sp. CY312]